VTIDTELETWQREWRHQTEPLPELKRKIRRQNLRTVAAIVAICTCLAFSTVAALRSRSSLLAGLAAGIGFSSILVGGYTWWVRRGAWRPTAQTTLAYAELCHRRAVAKARTLRFSLYFLLIATVLFAGFVAWNWRNAAIRDVVIVAAMVVEFFFLRHYEQRKKQEIQETKKLVQGMKE
jgi:Ca2+/Na+ antiporter